MEEAEPLHGDTAGECLPGPSLQAAGRRCLLLILQSLSLCQAGRQATEAGVAELGNVLSRCSLWS